MSQNKFDSVDLPIDEDNQVEEAAGHDMKNAEGQSVAATKSAEGATKKAPARKGDKANAQSSELPKTKAGMINAGYQKMASMKKEDLEDLLVQLGVSEISEEQDEDLEESAYDFSDDLNALVESEATLSDEFKAKTAVIFETAIKSKLAEEVGRLEDEYQSRLDEELEATRTDLVEKVDSYLNYVVENWMEENKLAIESGLRTEIAEDFMGKLKDLFEESYIAVPESKIDLVDELAEQVEELEEKLNKQTESAIQMSEMLESFQREAVIREHSRDLAETEIAKLKSLVESLDFEDQEVFSSKVKTVKESYFKKEINEEVVETNDDWADEEVTVSSAMSAYLNAIKKTSK
jgi:hypothetical protein